MIGKEKSQYVNKERITSTMINTNQQLAFAATKETVQKTTKHG